jgi:hypothetical protein
MHESSHKHNSGDVGTQMAQLTVDKRSYRTSAPTEDKLGSNASDTLQTMEWVYHNCARLNT